MIADGAWRRGGPGKNDSEFKPTIEAIWAKVVHTHVGRASAWACVPFWAPCVQRLFAGALVGRPGTQGFASKLRCHKNRKKYGEVLGARIRLACGMSACSTTDPFRSTIAPDARPILAAQSGTSISLPNPGIFWRSWVWQPRGSQTQDFAVQLECRKIRTTMDRNERALGSKECSVWTWRLAGRRARVGHGSRPILVLQSGTSR